jgi:hypothetical protein
MNGIRRRVEKLERAELLSDRNRSVEHRIKFMDSDGRVSSTLSLSEGRQEWLPHEVSEGSGPSGGQKGAR